MIFTLFTKLLVAAGIFISLHVICLIYDYRLTLINFVVFFLIMVANYFVVYYSSKQQKQNKSSKYGELLSQSLGNIFTISSFNAYNWSIAAVHENIFRASEEYINLSYHIGFFFGCSLFLISAGYGIVLYFGGNWYVNRTLEFGDYLRVYLTIFFGQLFIGSLEIYIRYKCYEGGN